MRGARCRAGLMCAARAGAAVLGFVGVDETEREMWQGKGF